MYIPRHTCMPSYIQHYCHRLVDVRLQPLSHKKLGPTLGPTLGLPGPGTLSPGTLGPRALGPGTLGPRTRGPGALGPAGP